MIFYLLRSIHPEYFRSSEWTLEIIINWLQVSVKWMQPIKPIRLKKSDLCLATWSQSTERLVRSLPRWTSSPSTLIIRTYTTNCFSGHIFTIHPTPLPLLLFNDQSLWRTHWDRTLPLIHRRDAFSEVVSTKRSEYIVGSFFFRGFAFTPVDDTTTGGRSRTRNRFGRERQHNFLWGFITL